MMMMMISVCAVVSNSARQSGRSSLSLITSLSVLVLFLRTITPHCALTHWLTAKQSRVCTVFLHPWVKVSERTCVEGGGEVGLQLFMSVFSVWMSCTSMHLPVWVRTVCPSLCGPLRRGWGFATAVMNLVSVHRLPLHLSRQAGSLAGDHVLFLLAH